MALDPKKHEMPTQEPQVRAHNFNEVALGYDEATAIAEASRCLSCKNQPCVSGCPVNIHIPDFLKQVKLRPAVGRESPIAEIPVQKLGKCLTGAGIPVIDKNKFRFWGEMFIIWRTDN